jgi:hypothetical protein
MNTALFECYREENVRQRRKIKELEAQLAMARKLIQKLAESLRQSLYATNQKNLDQFVYEDGNIGKCIGTVGEHVSKWYAVRDEADRFLKETEPK